jgi:2-oxo-4-hydroxy-4-carboxy--5-ureidoimidazoline (OHCU) decarboxylase
MAWPAQAHAERAGGRMMTKFNRARAEERVAEKTAAYQKANADLRFAREELYEALVAAHPDEAQDALTIRELADMSGLSFGRVGQILRGE